MDTDAKVVLCTSLSIVLLNLIFILSVFVYMCCCIDVISIKQKPSCKRMIGVNFFKRKQPLVTNDLERIVLQASNSYIVDR